MKIRLYTFALGFLLMSFAYAEQRVSVQNFSRDDDPQEALQDVLQTRQELLFKSMNINLPKPKKPKDPRRGFYALVNLGAVITPSLGTSSMLGFEAGYDFIFKRIHSLRVFGFFDRTNYAAFADLEFDAAKPNRMQIYRGGISAEYRIYVNNYIGFRVRLASLGAFSLSRTSNEQSPILDTRKVKWFYPTIAFGPIFSYGRHHELFIGYDLLDYNTERGMSVNYIKYSLRF